MTTPKTQRSPQEYGGANGSAHPWHKLPRWQKRIRGWVCYQLQSWFALLWPEAADRIMYKTLRDQFEEPNVPHQARAVASRPECGCSAIQSKVDQK